MLEDMGFFCVDNLPVALLPNFGQIAFDRKIDVNQVAVTVDIRSAVGAVGCSAGSGDPL